MEDNVHILIVEDSQTQATTIKIFLEKNGYNVSVCHDGEEAWAFMQNQEVPPSLVISDIVMPNMDGYELCEKIRQNEKYNNVMVMLLTALSEPSDIIRGLKSQADSFLIKPYNKSFLLGRIGHLLEYQNFIKEMPSDMGLAIDYFGQRHFLTSNRVQNINDLLSVHDRVETQSKELKRALDAERKLKESEERLIIAGKAAYDLIYEWNVARDTLDWFGDIDKMLGYEKGGIRNDTGAWLELIHPEDRVKLKNAVDLHKKSTKPIQYEYRVRHKDGTIRYWNDHALPFLDENGFPHKWIGVCTDITEKKRAESVLKKNEERLSTMLGSLTDHISMMDRDLNIVWANETAVKMFGENLIGKKCYNVYHGLETPCKPHPCIVLKAFEDEQSHSHETQVIDKNGETRYFHCTSNVALRDETNKPLTVMEVSRDITEQKMMEKALKESENKYRRIYDNLLDAYYEASIDGTILEISPSIERFSKYKREELIGKSLYEIYTNPEERDKLVETIVRDGRVNEYELHFTDKDGSQHICSINTMLVKDDKGEPYKLVGVARDISARKQAEKEKVKLKERLVRSQKMESLGLLAGGVAHDLNNVLSGIVSYPDLLLMDLSEDSPLRKPILTIQKSGQKAADIVQDLLTLARRGVSTTEVVNLNIILSDYLKSPEYHQLLNFYPDLSIDTNFENALLNIKGSSIHLKKTIMNLVSNAAEAHPSDGKIVISTHNEYIDIPIKKYEEIREGDYVVLKVADNGIGIADEDLSRIFEPFYSKKVMGRSGTGLGMAVVWGSVQDHNGYINIESTEGEGTTFFLYFPVTRETSEKEKGFISVEDYMGSNESILVVDDINEQREIATSLLSRLNYSVSAVSSGEEAIEYLKSNSTDLVLLDMIMDPGIDGLDTYKKIINDHSRQKAVIASGFSETDRVKEALKIGVGQYIKKPYTLKKIGIAIKEELKK